jgi:hypothetical protein
MSNIIISILQSDKTSTISPILEEQDIVRTGTIRDELSFLHSVLYACSSDYRSSTDEEKTQQAENLKHEMSKIDKTEWRKIDANFDFLEENINLIIGDFLKFINKRNIILSESPAKKMIMKLLFKDDKENRQRDSGKIELYKLIFDLLPQRTIEKHILPSSREKCPERTVSEYNNTIMNEVSEHLSTNKIFTKLLDKKKNFIINTFKIFFENLTEELDNDAYEKYNKEKQASDFTVSSELINKLSAKFNKNIYVFNGRNKLPIKDEHVNFIKNKKSIAVLQLRNHYEVLGKNINRKILREFDPDDAFIINIGKYFSDPNFFSGKFRSFRSNQETPRDASVEASGRNEFLSRQRSFQRRPSDQLEAEKPEVRMPFQRQQSEAEARRPFQRRPSELEAEKPEVRRPFQRRPSELEAEKPSSKPLEPEIKTQSLRQNIRPTEKVGAGFLKTNVRTDAEGNFVRRNMSERDNLSKRPSIEEMRSRYMNDKKISFHNSSKNEDVRSKSSSSEESDSSNERSKSSSSDEESDSSSSNSSDSSSSARSKSSSSSEESDSSSARSKSSSSESSSESSSSEEDRKKRKKRDKKRK